MSKRLTVPIGIGTRGEYIKIPKMFTKTANDRLIWVENYLKEKGYRIKMTSTNVDDNPVYVKTRGNMEIIIDENPKASFKLTELK